MGPVTALLAISPFQNRSKTGLVEGISFLVTVSAILATFQGVPTPDAWWVSFYTSFYPSIFWFGD